MTATPQRHPRPGRPKDPEKRQAILDAAKRLFPRHGLDGVSMEAIAAEAGVSKLTVYSHFKDKDALFAAAVKAKCDEQLPHAIFELNPGTGPIRRQLLTIARRLHALVNSQESIWMYRTLAAQGPHAPKLAQMFYAAGPQRTLGEFEALLRKADAAGALRVPDPARSAEHFLCLVKGLSHMRVLIGCCGAPAARAVEAHLRSVVDLFLRAHVAGG